MPSAWIAASRGPLSGVLLLALGASAALAACDGGTPAGTSNTATTAAPDTATAAPGATSATAAPATAAPEPTAAPTASAEPSASAAAPAPSGATAAGTVAAATPTASASAAAEKDWGCGGKGQKACPMQGWMKGVMALALSGGDKDKIAKALSYIAAKPPPGMGNWSAIASEGAAAAAAGNIDGAKESCKKCHGAYQAAYKATMRANPW